MGKCKAIIRFGDDEGDNCTTFHCQLDEGHEGEHSERGDMGYGVKEIPYTLIWTGESDNDYDDYDDYDPEGEKKEEKPEEPEPYADLEEEYNPDGTTFQKTRKKNNKVDKNG
jgi:hypothetical protein